MVGLGDCRLITLTEQNGGFAIAMATFISTMFISEATERSAETNLPDSSACNRSGSMVRRPSVAAASQRPDVRRTYKELADRWDEMARQAEQPGPE